MRLAQRRVVAVALALGWFAALPLDVATTSHTITNQTFSGIGLLFLGPIGPLEGMFSWYANPLLLLGLMTSLRPTAPPPRAMIVIATIMTLLIINAAFWRRIPDDSGANPIIALHAGYWLWMATMTAGTGWIGALGIAGARVAAASPAAPEMR